MRPRRGVLRRVRRAGLGVHSGAPCTVELAPAPAGAGIVLHTPGGAVPALLSHIESGFQRTLLRAGHAQAETVEHLLAACWALGVDDLCVHMDAREVPILDGSAAPWVAALEAAGLFENGGEMVEPLRVRRRIEHREGPRRIALEPAEALVLVLRIVFAEPGIGRQSGVFRLSPQRFARDLAPARTFGPARALPALQAQGLVRGASLANTAAFQDGRVLNPGGLRFADEPLRHKALDLVGDLALLGRPLLARVEAEQPGHALTHAVLRKALAAGALG